MSASFSNNLFFSSPLKMEDEVKVNENQGIVSVLGPDCERGKGSSLRRTLSADMSSKKWLAQHGFSSASPMKKTASSQQFLVSIADSFSSSSSEGEEDYEEGNEEVEKQPGLLDIWSSIQSEENKKKEKEKKKEKAGGEFDLWSSFLSQKANDNLSKSMPDLPPPYIHPLVKTSSSSLSEKSLEICTESLGSETGSEGFSSSPPSETGEIEDEAEVEQVWQQQEKVWTQGFDKEELVVVKYNKKSPPKSFPPPLPSLSRHHSTSSLHMRSHRKNGRLLIEAVSIPWQNYFRAQRQGGRLLLTFLNTPTNHINDLLVEEEENNEQAFDEDFEMLEEEEDDDKQEEEEEAEEENVVMREELAPKLASEMMNVHRPELMMNKFIRLANTNPTWSKSVTFKAMEEEEVAPPNPLPQSLPPQARVIGKLIPTPPAAMAAASFNAYDYCWRRTKTTAVTAVLNNPLTQHPPPFRNSNSNSNNNMFIVSKNEKKTVNDQQQELVLLKGGNKADYFVPFLRGCKEPRRSLLFWEPYCVATS